MKTVFLSLCSLLLFSHCNANSLHDQLCEFNPNWELYASYTEDKPSIQIHSEAHYVQVHLSFVLPILEVQTANCPDELKTQRNHLIAALTKYRKEGVFPINYHMEKRIPVFIDEHNTHCAVGYLMRYSGYGELAKAISEWNNYVWIKDLDWPQVKEWQELSGFTFEELKLIQGAYDFYPENALYLPNKHEIPQKPEVMTLFFDEEKKHVWVSGEGAAKTLNGAWIQNYAPGISWIKGFYNQGKRTGRWEEYFPGTDLLQRTEHWRNDELNGVRTRYDREGNMVEELLFRDGNVLTKTNYDFKHDLKWVRTPIDSAQMNTKIYTLDGGLLAEGKESVYNPGNLEWFQNIELTALNMAAITARDNSPETAKSLIRRRRSHLFMNELEPLNFFNTRPLVEYHKEGEWTFYSEMAYPVFSEVTLWNMLQLNYVHLSHTFNLQMAEDYDLDFRFSSFKAFYLEDELVSITAVEKEVQAHYVIEYHNKPHIPIHFQDTQNQHQNVKRSIKSIGQLDKNGARIGTWKHYQANGILAKIEEFIVPEPIRIPKGEGVSENY
ncbi:MAG: toxin-antitoxin system YwqK family antitoxin [Flavobacteriales bacterium]